MKTEFTIKNTQQFCPHVDSVVILTVRCKERGNLIEGTVVSCNRKCEKPSFCWINRHILTALW